MTNEEMRIAIAGALGINPGKWWCPECQEEVEPSSVTFGERHDYRRGGCGEMVGERINSNYPEDLNACRDFETMLLKSTNEEEWFKYDRMLGQITETFTWYATAAQKCEAFLRVKGLWKEMKG